MDQVTRVAGQFRKLFKKEPFLFKAPGRINLIGEHVDYNEGLVLPGAVDKHLAFAISPALHDRCNIFALDFEEGVTFSIFDLNPGETWVNYLHGVIDGMQRRGRRVGAVDCVFAGNIPVGSGLSSSAALCAGFAYALNEGFGLGFSKTELALIAQYAEREFAGANVGLMDQYASLFGEENGLLLLDCRTLTHESIPFSFPGYQLMLIDTHVKHSIASTAYNDRRSDCETGVRILQKRYPKVSSLRDVTTTMLYEQQAALGEDIFIRCLFVVEEINRTRETAELIKAKDLAGVGERMYRSHWGLSQAYEVSCEELDFLVMTAEEDRSVVPGARMMGGGFGGCTINLVSDKHAGIFKEKTREKYFATFRKEPDFYPVNLSLGVHRVQP